VFPPLAPLNLVTVEMHAVEADIDGPIATVAVTQVFRNDSGQTAEGVYVFPLPADAAVSDFQMTVNGETLEGRLLTGEEARRIYEQIVRQQRDPALLEYIDRGVFQANVFPIPPGESRTLEFSYTQVLEQENGLRRFSYPLRTRHYSSLPPENVSLAVTLRNQGGLRTIYSPELPIRLERTGDDGAVISYAASGEQPPTDLELYFGSDDSAIGLNLLSYKPAGEDGYFALLTAPSIEVAADEVVARDLILVVDVSGSMKGDKMEQARAAARYVVEALNPDDRFDVIAFSSASDAFAGGLQAVNAASRAAALDWIDDLRANGSTDINRALLEALAELDGRDKDGDNRPAYILFLTDGQPTLGEINPQRIVDNAQNNAPVRSVRLFPFGIGYDVNADLLDTLGSSLGGRSAYVRPEERIDEAVGSFYAQISTPVLASIALDLGEEAGVDQLFPYPLPDLFAGEQLVVVGRYAAGGVIEVQLTGEVNGAERLYVYPKRELVSSGGEPFVAKLWATRRIGALLDQVRRGGPQQELVDEIVDLSLRYGIVTPYTSYLVLEPGVIEGAPGFDTTAGAALPQARSILGDAEKGVAVAAAEAVAAAPTGAAAVEASIALNALQGVETVVQEDAVRYAAGRTFQRQGQVMDATGRTLDLWVDTTYREDMALETVLFGSDAYFALLDQPDMAEWLALSPEIVIVTGENTALRVTTVE
jgi:Ca-activated chloride channel family protein